MIQNADILVWCTQFLFKDASPASLQTPDGRIWTDPDGVLELSAKQKKRLKGNSFVIIQYILTLLIKV